MSYGDASEMLQGTDDRVWFGKGETDSMPGEWATRGLMWLKEHRPQVFAEMMTEGVFGIEWRRRRANGAR